MWENQVGTVAKNVLRINGGRHQESCRLLLLKKRRRRARCSELAWNDGVRLGSRRMYGLQTDM